MGKSARIKRERCIEATAEPEARRSHAWAMWAVVLGVASLTLAVAVFAPSKRDGSAGEEAPAFAAVEVAGDSVPDFDPEARQDRATGESAPVLSGTDLENEPITIGGKTGTPSIVMFLAHWCPHCQAEVPRIVEHLESKGTPDGVRLVGVVTATSEQQPNFPPGEWLASEQWRLPTLVDDEVSSAGTAWGVTQFPYFVVVDADGTVLERAAGELTMSEFDELVNAAKARVAGPK